MQRNLYFRTVFQRKNILLTAIYDFFFMIASYPRMIIEVFIRKRFGERYFSLATSITIAILLLVSPKLLNLSGSIFSFRQNGRYYDDRGITLNDVTWYLFIVAFLFFSYLRWNEIRRNQSTFNFGTFTLSAGEISDIFLNLKPFGKYLDPRIIETICEPALFFIIGLILHQFGLSLGNLFIFCSIVYSLSYFAAYKKGDNFSMDILDEIEMNKQMDNGFVNDLPASQTNGVRFYMKKPNSKAKRDEMVSQFIVNDENDISVAF